MLIDECTAGIAFVLSIVVTLGRSRVPCPTIPSGQTVLNGVRVNPDSKWSSGCCVVDETLWQEETQHPAVATHLASALRSGVWQSWVDVGSGSPISGELKGKAHDKQMLWLHHLPRQ